MNVPIHRRHARQKGVTLLEIMAVLSVVGVLAALAVPSYGDMMRRKRLEGAAEAVASLLTQARSEAMKANAHNIWARFSSSGGWCAGIGIGGNNTASNTTPTNCDCNLTDPSNGSACSMLVDTGNNASTLRRLTAIRQADNYTDISLSTSSLSSGSLRFDPVRGQVLPQSGSVVLSADNGDRLEVVISTLGQIRICTRNGSYRYDACP